MTNTQDLTQQVKEASSWIKPLQDEIGRVVVGQRYLVDGLLLGLLTNGHVLLEGVPCLVVNSPVRGL
jgi:MoxR-like ATPase